MVVVTENHIAAFHQSFGNQANSRFFLCQWHDDSFLISRYWSHFEAATALREKLILLKGRVRWEWKIRLVKEFVVIQTWRWLFFSPTLRRRICVNIFVVSEIYLTSNLPFLKVSFKGIKSIHNAVQPTSPYPFSELI